MLTFLDNMVDLEAVPGPSRSGSPDSGTPAPASRMSSSTPCKERLHRIAQRHRSKAHRLRKKLEQASCKAESDARQSAQHVSSTNGPRTLVSDCLEISLKCSTTIQMENSEVWALYYKQFQRYDYFSECGGSRFWGRNLRHLILGHFEGLVYWTSIIGRALKFSVLTNSYIETWNQSAHWSLVEHHEIFQWWK